MQEGFDAYHFVVYLGRRWRIFAVTCGVALAIAALVSLLVPKQYTATSSILIDPPAGNDPRTATAVSPTYLESLRSFEHLASSDTLFLRAVEKFHLASPDGTPTLETLKRRALKVSKVRDTRILEISATWPDPKVAQALAQYLAEETVNLSQSLLRGAEGDLVQDASKQLESARARFDEAQTAWSSFSRDLSLDALRGDIESLIEERAGVRRRLLSAQEDAADWTEKTKALGAAPSADLERARVELNQALARAAVLQKQLREFDADLSSKSATLARQTARREQLLSQVTSAKSVYDAAAARLREVQAAVGYRGERLKVIDPGVVPTRPSFPNLLVNLVAALLLALIAALVYLGIAYTHQRRGSGSWHDEPLHIQR